MRQLVKRGASIDQVWWGQRTALVGAALKARPRWCVSCSPRAPTSTGGSTLKYLLGAKARVDSLNREQQTPLHFAAALSDGAMARLLLDLAVTVAAKGRAGGQRRLRLVPGAGAKTGRSSGQQLRSVDTIKLQSSPATL